MGILEWPYWWTSFGLIGTTGLVRLFILYLNKERRTLNCTLRSKVRDIVQEGILELSENRKLSIYQEKPVVFAILGPVQFSKIHFVSSVSLGTSNKNPQQRLRGDCRGQLCMHACKCYLEDNFAISYLGVRILEAERNEG